MFVCIFCTYRIVYWIIPNYMLKNLVRTDTRFECWFCHWTAVEVIPMMMRGGRLMGLSSQVLGMRCFSTEIFVSSK